MSNCCQEYPKCGCGPKKPYTPPPYEPPPQPVGVGPTMFCDIDKACMYIMRNSDNCGCQHICEKDDADDWIKLELQLCAVPCKACDEYGGYIYSPYLVWINELSINSGRVIKEKLLDESWEVEKGSDVIARLQAQHEALLKKLGCFECVTVPQMPTMTTQRLNIIPAPCRNKCKGRCRCG